MLLSYQFLQAFTLVTTFFLGIKHLNPSILMCYKEEFL